MFADPQTITVNSVAKTLPAVARGADSSTYKMDTGDYTLTISKSRTGSRKRFAVKIEARKIAPDPLTASNNVEYNSAVILSMNMPLVGYANTEVRDIALALAGWATSANLLKVLGEET